MELDFAILARAANAADGELFIHGGGLSDIYVSSIPAIIPISIAARFSAPAAEIGTTAKINLRLYEPLVLEPSASPPPLEVALEAGDEELDADEVFVVVVMNIAGLRVPRAGLYRFELLIDGRPVKMLTLRIRLGRRDKPIPTREVREGWEQRPPAGQEDPVD